MPITKISELKTLVEQGIVTTLKIGEGHNVAEATHMDANTYGDVVAVELDMVDEEYGVLVYKVTVNFSRYETYNKSIAKIQWYDDGGYCSLKWHEHPTYPEDKQADIFLQDVMPHCKERDSIGDDVFIVPMEDKYLELIKRWQAMQPFTHKTYPRWLEDKVLQYQHMIEELVEKETTAEPEEPKPVGFWSNLLHRRN